MSFSGSGLAVVTIKPGLSRSHKAAVDDVPWESRYPFLTSSTAEAELMLAGNFSSRSVWAKARSTDGVRSADLVAQWTTAQYRNIKLTGDI
ncbi:uncharacterized protein LOC135397938 isoform X2 [Ornithodoros turicata]|uniref:uncharacterized protein LOC135397938 isoform X2 n=1 Tax=Ornithodoros turicata TaxID=34597 RepID=UPI003138ABD7